jgi:hypothetical protein
MAPAYDLSALGKRLARERKHGELVAAIEKAASAASAFQDLAQAADNLRLLNRIVANDEWKAPFSNDEAGSIAGSLFDSSIILYARATDTAPVGRLRWFGADKLRENHKDVHKQVMWIRNKELAHFGSGALVDGTPMVTEALALVEFEDHAAVMFRASRTRNRDGFAQRFAGLVDVVSAMAREAGGRRMAEVIESWNKSVADDQSILALLASTPLPDLLNGEGFYNSPLFDENGVSTFSNTITNDVPRR